jgi:hypothetical protein
MEIARKAVEVKKIMDKNLAREIANAVAESFKG